MTVLAEISDFLMTMKRRRLDEGENQSEVVGETCAQLLIISHLMAGFRARTLSSTWTR